jgi:hypothetical protein
MCCARLPVRSDFMWSCQRPDRDALVTPERRPFGVAVIGGPTTVIDIAGPAVGTPAIGEIDAVLLSHDLHPDNFTAVPARHGPADGELNEEGFINCEVTGFLLNAPAGTRVHPGRLRVGRNR